MCTKKEISEAIKDLPFGLTIEDILFEIIEAPEIYAKCCKGDFQKIIYTTYIRKKAKESEKDIKAGKSYTLEELKKEMEEIYESFDIK